ncbi:hypothetical protein [Roseateles sp. P5_E8]
MTGLRGLALTASLLLAACGGGGGGAADSPPPVPPVVALPGVLSITTNPQLVPTPPTTTALAAALASAMDLAYSTGARGQQINFSWGALEPSAGNYDAAKLAEIGSALDRAARLSLVQYVGLQPINTLYRDLPADLVGRAFDDPVVKQRFRALLDRVVGLNVGRIQYLALGNEVDIYLAAHPAELAAYTAFFRDAASYARTLDARLKVGVTGTADGVLGANADLLAGLNNAGADVVMLTYYPIRFDANGTITVRDPAGVGAEVRRLLTFAGTRPLVFQEAGFPSSSLNLSSQAMQAAFFRELAAAWRAADGRIPYLNVFLLHDFTTQTCADLAVHYQFSDSASFRAYLCSLGLRQSDGQAKSAWQALLDGLKT